MEASKLVLFVEYLINPRLKSWANIDLCAFNRFNGLQYLAHNFS